ncbi:MAG: protein-L-isoaspartate(D-aspartate) O-methyltransferase [Candidatus Aenigmarchaeota archaeon]|nr:protein-L-isoaspartate(D-aspartate) O-methyltransferase [Candidatus Aenigmarchaeota archaeon]
MASMREKREMLIKGLVRDGYLTRLDVIRAFREVPRELFVPEGHKRHAYADEPLPVPAGQTISAPHMIAIMLCLLELKEHDKVLEIGTGSGYNAALISRMVKGMVYTVEYFPELAAFARNNLAKAKIKNVLVFHGDGSKGLEEHAPYDKIIVTCACPDIPKPLIGQLKEGGMMLIPVGGGRYQELLKITKRKGKITKENHGGCVFVPLRG